MRRFLLGCSALVAATLLAHAQVGPPAGPEQRANRNQPNGYIGADPSANAPLLHGGTGASTAAQARVNLGAAARGANSDITGLTGLTGAQSGLTTPGSAGTCLVSSGTAMIWSACPGGGGGSTPGGSNNSIQFNVGGVTFGGDGHLTYDPSAHTFASDNLKQGGNSVFAAVHNVSLMAQTGADPSGATDSSAALNAAINEACLYTASHIQVDAGTYDIKFYSAITCPNVLIDAPVGVATFIADAAATGAPYDNALPPGPLILNIGYPASNIRFRRIVFDGNVANNQITADPGLVGITAPIQRVTFEDDVFQNSNSTGIFVVGGPRMLANLTAQANPGDQTVSVASTLNLTLGTLRTNLHPGAYLVGTTGANADLKVQSVTSNTITFQKGIPDTLLLNTALRFTPAFTTSADVLPGQTTFPTSDTSQLGVMQTIWLDNGCMRQGTHILSIADNVSVTVDKGPTCTVPASSSIAAADGNEDVVFSRTVFQNLGMPRHLQASRNYTLSADATQATPQTATYPCVSIFAGVCSGIGLIPGNTTGSSPPVGVPANDLVVSRTVNDVAHTFTVTYATQFTQTVTAGTVIPHAVEWPPGTAFGIWSGSGAWFANTGLRVLDSHFIETYSSPLFFNDQSHVIVARTEFALNGREFQSPTIAPSACIYPSLSVDVLISDVYCSGASGNGIEAYNTLGLRVVNSRMSHNGTRGIFLASGGGLMLDNVETNDNGQYLAGQYAQNIGVSCGVSVSGSATFSLPGTVPDITIGTLTASDTQASPTQMYGICRYNQNSTINLVKIGALNAQGNTVAPVQARQLAGAAGIGFTITSGTTDTSALTDSTLRLNKTSGAPFAETLLACNVANDGYELRIVDEKGDASLHNITVAPASGTILHQASYIIAQPYASVKFKCDGSSANYTVDITFPPNPPAPPFTGPLDLAATKTAFACGARNLSWSNSGPLLKVRRDSDNTTADISAVANGSDFDVAAATAFANGANLFVATCYDQSGNGNSPVQASLANQPQLVLNAINGKPGICFGTGAGTVGLALGTSPSVLNNLFASGGNIIVVDDPAFSAPSVGGFLIQKRNASLGWDFGLAASQLDRTKFDFSFGTLGVWTVTTNGSLAPHVDDLTYNGGSTSNVPVIGRDGAFPTIAAFAPTGSPADDTGTFLWLGNNTSNNAGFPGCIADWIVLGNGGVDAPTLENIRKNEGTYWGIAVN